MRLPPSDDTIAAIATAPGVGAVGIVRLSGPDAYRVAGALFAPASGARVEALAAGRVVYGRVEDREQRGAARFIDDALLLTFRAPHSYTGQDAVEIQCHGGPAVLKRVLALCVRHGARLAGPGEYTLRAYLSGRLDLAQAEGVLGIVNAHSERARRNAAMGLSRALSDELDALQSDVTRAYGALQATLDYPEEGVEEAQVAEPLGRALARIEALLATAEAGRLAQRGARLALVGRPNAGKSSLLNALLGFDRSIVSDTPGTTRDYLEAPLEIGGVPVTAIDTAGIRDTRDAVEASGVALARDIAASADLTLALLDRARPLDADDRALVESLRPRRTLWLATKNDLPPCWPEDAPGVPLLAVSARTGEGLATLRERVRDALVGDAANAEVWISNERHAEALQRAREHLQRALEAPDDLAALDLEGALQALAEITGRGDIAEETLAHIFATFCVGK